MLSQTSSSASVSATQNVGKGGSLFFLAVLGPIAFVSICVILYLRFCTRGSARHRTMRNGEGVDPIDLYSMSARRRHQRPGKNVMTMEEVNKRFPILKYKDWVAARVREGPSISGGVAVTTSLPRTASLNEDNAVDPLSVPADLEQPISRASEVSLAGEVTTTADLGETTGKQKGMETPAGDMGAAPTIGEESHILKEIQTTDITDEKHMILSVGDEDEAEYDHDYLTVACELPANPGNFCAICLDTLRQEHDIRGLDCGHPFHVGCVDPWLTTRCACCPLCKTDYYGSEHNPKGKAARPTAAAVVNGSTSDPVPALQSEAAIPRRWRPPISNLLRAVHIPTMLIPSRARGMDATAEEPTEPSPTHLEAGVIH